jgi:uncharacterized protein (TIGR02594 family)
MLSFKSLRVVVLRRLAPRRICIIYYAYRNQMCFALLLRITLTLPNARLCVLHTRSGDARIFLICASCRLQTLLPRQDCTRAPMPIPWFSVATHFNPTIAEMFRISGYPETKDDETPWCAACVGSCLPLAGYRDSGNLGSRSYRGFGEDLGDHPRRRCIAAFWRGNPNATTGHVTFYDHYEGHQIVVVGGNQGDAVTSGIAPRLTDERVNARCGRKATRAAITMHCIPPSA